MPLSDGIEFSYDGNEFDPRPLFSINKEVIRTPANTGLGSKYTLTLEGHILPTGIDLQNRKGGLTKVFNDESTAGSERPTITSVSRLRKTFERDYKLLLLKCEDYDSIISGYPKVLSLDIRNAGDNYVRRADYTVNLELWSLDGTESDGGGVDCGGNPIGDFTTYGLESLSEEYSIEFLDERIGILGTAVKIFEENIPSVFNVVKSITAQGASIACGQGGSYIEPWQRASDYVRNSLDNREDFRKQMSGILCLDGMNMYNDFRSVSVNKTDGTVSATQTMIVTDIPNALGTTNGLEDFEVTVERGSDSPFTTVNIAGTIKGLGQIDYNSPIDNVAGTPECPPESYVKSLFSSAVTHWEGQVSGNLYSRASKALTAHGGLDHVFQAGTLNTNPLTESIGYNIMAGTVSYNFVYDDRTLVNPSAISETIVYNYNNRADLFASIAILGKDNGPLLQELNTTGPLTEEVSIDAFVEPGSDLATIKGYYETNIVTSLPSTTADQTFVTSDTHTWEPALGHFTWTKAWELGDCS